MKRNMILILLVFLVSCITIEQQVIKKNELQYYQWVYFKYAVFEYKKVDIVAFHYEDIRFNRKWMEYYFIEGYSDTNGVPIHIDKEEASYYKYWIRGNKIIFLLENKKVSINIKESGDFEIKGKIFKKEKKNKELQVKGDNICPLREG